MSNILNLYGTDKEVKFVRVSKKDGHIFLYFSDMTFVMIDDIKVIVEAE